MKQLTVNQNRDLLCVMYERLTRKDLSAKYVVAMMHVYSRVYGETVEQLNIVMAR